MIDRVMVPKREPRAALLPLGRRCPEGADEGAFIAPLPRLPPHQFGQMTCGRAIIVSLLDRLKPEAASHGLTSSPRGERSRRRPT
jgi:hypothetical protein